MTISEEQLAQIFPGDPFVAAAWVDALNNALQTYRIDTPQRIAAFIAQVGYESANFTHLVEVLDFTAAHLAALWPDRFQGADGQPNSLAFKLGGQPQAIANVVYANRLGNGPPASGDGWRYRGRGLIQLTGRSNYQQAGAALNVDLENHPELLLQPRYASLSAAWYWSAHGLNSLADAEDFRLITLRINGGLNGYTGRVALWTQARQVLA